MKKATARLAIGHSLKLQKDLSNAAFVDLLQLIRRQIHKVKYNFFATEVSIVLV